MKHEQRTSEGLSPTPTKRIFINRPSELPVLLTDSELIGLEYGIQQEYWPAIALLLKRFTNKKHRHPIDERFTKVSKDKWWSLFGKDEKATNAIKVLREQALDELKSYKTEEYPMGYKLKQTTKELLLSATRTDSSPTQREYSQLVEDKKAVWQKAIQRQAKNNRQDQKKRKLVKLEKRFEQFPVNLRSIYVATPILEDWARFLSSKQEAEPTSHLARDEVIALINNKGIEAAKDYLIDTCAQLRLLKEEFKDDAILKEQRYFRAEAGRLYACGKSIRLQAVTGLTLKIALNGCYDFDISTCCHSIALHTARKHKLPCEFLDKYVAEKKYYRKRIAEETGLAPEEVKWALTTLSYGGKDGLFGSIR